MVDSHVETTVPAKGLQPGQGIAIIGLAVAAVAIWAAPLVLGPISMLLGAISMWRGEQRGRWVILLAVVAIALGLLLNSLPDKFAYS